MAFLLSDKTPVARPLFAELLHPSDQVRTAQAAFGSSKKEPPALTDPLDAKLALLRERRFLTERECEVVRHLAQGRSKTAIGEKLFISENTVRTYVKNIYGKLDIHSKQQLLDLLDTMDQH